jgi:lysozyme
VPPPPDPVSAALAEMKALSDAGNILPPIKEPFFTRPIETWPTIVTRWPTYEPCPLHENFRFASTTGYTPNMTEGDKTYDGSGGAGNSATSSPPLNTNQGATNTTLPPPDTSDSIVAKDLNMQALECQLKIHEGVKYVSYLDSINLPTAGIGHLLRSNEIALYPIGTPVSSSQVSQWFQQDSSTCIKDAQNFVGIDCWSNLDDNRKRALADLAYNMGGPRLGKFVSLKAAMQAGDYNAAGDSLRNSKWFTQVGVRGPQIVSQIVNGVDPNGCDKKFPAS